MTHITATIDGRQFRRVSKSTARRAYNSGYDVYIVPRGLMPDNMWITASKMPLGEFDRVASDYEHFNCCYRETGRYAAYYIPDITIADAMRITADAYYNMLTH